MFKTPKPRGRPVNNFQIVKLLDIAQEEHEKTIKSVDALFFDAANTQEFASAAEKHTFRQTWLGRYLTHYRDHFFLALSDSGELVGYLAGAPDNPARSDLFADIDYFALFPELCARYPAQLHVNVAPEFRGMGIGRTLIEAYSAHCQSAGCAGCHVITRKDADNVGYYQACGFEEVGRVRWQAGDRTLVFLGKSFVIRPDRGCGEGRAGS